MSRPGRIKSVTGIYHVMLRGINKQDIFCDRKDFQKFLNVLKICKEISGFKIHAYCLMSNHVHLLIQEGDEPLDIVFKRIGVRYVQYFNKKYDRIGSLFQDRYRSIPVNDDTYFICVLRYIHQNPVKAGIVKCCEDYEFSSYNSYFKSDSLVDTKFTNDLMSIEQFNRLHNESNTDYLLEVDVWNQERMSEEYSRYIFENHTGCKSKEEFKKLPKDKRREYIEILKKEKISISRICELTGVSRTFIYK